MTSYAQRRDDWIEYLEGSVIWYLEKARQMKYLGKPDVVSECVKRARKHHRQWRDYTRERAA